MIQIFGWTTRPELCHPLGVEEPISSSWHWQAIDPSRNMARDYHLWIQTDLFGWTTIERRWGRIGTKGQGMIASFADREQAESMAQQVRARREGAHKRLGVSYREIQ